MMSQAFQTAEVDTAVGSFALMTRSEGGNHMTWFGDITWSWSS